MVDINKQAFWHFTFKDILTILCSVAIPIALAIYTAIGSQQQKREAEKTRQFDLKQSAQLRQQTLYDEFINNIFKLDNYGYLKERKNPWAFANAYYRAAHRQWDTMRKADVLQFLKEKQLIGRNNCSNGCRTTKLDDIIRLNELNFDNVHLASETGVLNKLNLQCVSFDQVSMSNAVFSFASLNDVSFDGGRLDNVKFDGSSLLCASFDGVNLSGADFRNSDLTGAQFLNSDMSGAKITENQMKQAYFHNITMPNGAKGETTFSSTIKKSIVQTTTTIIETKKSTASLPSLTSTISTTSSTTTSASSTKSTSTTSTLTTTSTTASTATSTSTTSTSTSTTSTTTSTTASTATSTSTTSTSTTSTTTSTTSTTTTSTSTTSTTSTTTTAGNPCTTGNYLWNTSGITILDSSQVTKVTNMYIDSNNTLYITDEYTNTVVWRLLKNATSATIISGTKGSTGSSNTQLNHPQDVYVDTVGTMYVSDHYNHRVQKYINGSTVGTTIAGITGSGGSSLNQLKHPRYITLDPTQAYIYITDNDNHRIMRYSTTSTSGDNGTVVAGGNGAGNTITSLSYPWGIWYQPCVSSDLFITNNGGHSIMRWTPGAPSGTFIAGVPGTAGSNSTLLNNSMGIKLDNYLNMFVVDNKNHRIQMFCANNQTGITIAGTGVSGSTPTTLNSPRGIAFDSDMNMYVADFYNYRLQKFLKL
ncbi:unnamed protein product [Adineta steineri]|uniref:Uncharacterized protein n=1 Tax=Adineta steineri TaxID=433720 RepID=A0A815JF24_9BILA|nr:unnamed protein product [Adineta steineri]CAF3545194.1 unnamed protein product [Adineta steineri]